MSKSKKSKQPKQPKVCQRVRRGRTVYYCEIGGRQHGLGSDPIAAQAEFAALLAKHHARKQTGVDEPPKEQPKPKAIADNPLTVRAVLLAFLEFCKRENAESTYHFYARAISGDAKKSRGFVSFDEYLRRQGKGEMLVADFGPEVVNAWISKNFSHLSDNYRCNLIRPIQAAFNWAKQNRRDWRKQLADDPLAGLKKPAQTPREAYIDADQWAKVLATAGGALLDFLTILKETGCRPQEARAVEAKHFDREGRRWYFPKPIKKVRGTPKPRIVYLNDRAFEVCQRLALKHPIGPLFRNERGEPWKRNTLNHACRNLRIKLDFDLCPYALRHTFCTDALTRGVDPLTVAELMGHANGLMVMKVYQNLGKCTDHLRAALVKATG